MSFYIFSYIIYYISYLYIEYVYIYIYIICNVQKRGLNSSSWMPPWCDTDDEQRHQTASGTLDDCGPESWLG